MTDLTLDDSLVVWSESPAELGERPLVLLLHGRGSHEGDLAQLAPLLGPGAVYASPRAPLPFLGGGGYSWFPPAEPGLPGIEGVDAAATAVLDWLDRLAPAGPVAVVGFSQGGAVASHLLRHEPERFAAIAILSGFIVPGDAPADERLTTLRPPAFWGRDEHDPVIPAVAIENTAAWLPGHTSLVSRLYPGIAHSISREEIDEVRAFLGEHLAEAGTQAP